MRHTVGATYVTAALAYGWQDITTDRPLAEIICAQTSTPMHFPDGSKPAIVSCCRGSTPWALALRPYVAGQFTTFDLPAYAEHAIAGANTFALGYAAKDVTATRSELGLRADKSFALTDSILTLRAARRGRTISIRTAALRPPSRRCPARASWSTARRRPTTPR